ncbi:hypothetical protein M3Y97_00953800 [Aphelenchoides bicaudatus]|nr:hypothetical protein M3Y97_00953800 [Aphelenchoides bicaudatus]
MRNKYYEDLSLWMVDLCAKVIDTSMVSTGMLSLMLPIFSYVTTLLSYGFVSLVLFRRRNDRRNVSSKQRDHTAIWRLGVHLGVFTFSFCLMALAYAATFPMADSCLNWSSDLINQHNRYLQERSTIKSNPLVKREQPAQVECNLQHIYAFTRYVTLTALAATGWFTRMCVDPMIDLLLDTHIRRLIFPNRSLERATTILLETRLSGEAPSSSRTQ